MIQSTIGLETKIYMKDGFAWSKLTDKQKLDYLIFIVGSIGSIIISTLCSVIIYLNTQNERIRNESKKEIKENRVTDSLEKEILKRKLADSEERVIKILNTNAIKDSIWYAKFEKLRDEKRESNSGA